MRIHDARGSLSQIETTETFRRGKFSQIFRGLGLRIQLIFWSKTTKCFHFLGLFCAWQDGKIDERSIEMNSIPKPESKKKILEKPETVWACFWASHSSWHLLHTISLSASRMLRLTRSNPEWTARPYRSELLDPRQHLTIVPTQILLPQCMSTGLAFNANNELVWRVTCLRVQ